MKLHLAIIFILAFSLNLRAEDCKGYIISLKGDTLQGTLDIPIYKRALNTPREVQFADLWGGVKFKEVSAKEKKYKPADISGFGFDYNGQSFDFEIYDMQANSGKKAPKWMGKFVNNFTVFVLRINNGALPLYKEFWRSKEERSYEDTYKRKITNIKEGINTELYAKKEGTFIEIAPYATKAGRNLKSFMKEYLNIEEAYLKTIDDKTSFDDAEKILVKYNEWKKNLL